MKHRKRCHQLLSAILICLMVLSNFSSAFAVYAENGNEHVHTEDCYAQEGDLLCTLPEDEGHNHNADCYCPGGEYICGQIESEGHVHDESCYEDEDDTASPSNASSQKLICDKEESEGHTHTEDCVCPGGELICGLEESEGHTHSEDCYAKGGELICGHEETMRSSESDIDTIKELLISDENIAFDPETQTFIVVEIAAAVADHVTSLIQKGVLTDQAMENAMDWQYKMTVSINDDDTVAASGFYVFNGESLQKGTVDKDYFTASEMMVSSDKGKNIIILNKGDNCRIVPADRELFWGTNNTTTNPFPDSKVYAAPNPVNAEDLTGQECNDVQAAASLHFAYEWNLYNWVEIETWFINTEEKSVGFATDTIDAGTPSPVDYLIEIRDEEGNITPIPITIYEDYSWTQGFVMMNQAGIVSQYAERDSDDWWTEGGVRVPAGYDFRIRALNNDQPIGVYIGGSEQLESPGWDENGFRMAKDDFTTGQFIVEEYFMIPTEEIRIEKIADNAPKDEAFAFTATKNYPYYNSVSYEKTETVQMPLNNYPYTLYSSADNTKIGDYKTSLTGDFSLKNGQYAIFKVWKAPEDLLDYEDNYSTYIEGYKRWKEQDDPMPDSSVYTFREQEIPNCVTTIEHVTKDGASTVAGTYVDNVHNGDSIVFHNTFAGASAATGTLTITKKVTGTGTPNRNTEFEFTVTQNGNPASGQYSVNGGAEQPIPSDGKIKLKADESAVLTGLEPGEYLVTETTPTQASFKSTAFSVNGGTIQNGTAATVTVTDSAVGQTGGWKTENGTPVKDEDGYFTYTLTADQINADGNITVDCDALAEYMEAEMRNAMNWSSRSFKVKFVNETGSPIQYKDYSFDTVNWLPVGSTYTPSANPSMLNTNEGASSSSAGYGWGEVWQQIYPMLIGQKITSATLDATGFDGNQVRAAIAPLRCINPAVISYFKSNPGNGTLTGNRDTNSAQTITLLQMNALPELIKQAFIFENWEGTAISLPADDSRTYADFICAFYGVQSLDELTVAQKYNVLGTGYKGSPLMPYAGQSHITTYYANTAGNMANWCMPYTALNDGTLDYFKKWGFSDTRIAEGKTLKSGGQTFSADNAALYAYQPNYYLMETDPEVLRMAYEYLYDRCIRFTLDANNRPISTAIDNSATSDAGVGGIKDYMDKTDEATANVLAAMNGGAEIADGESLTLDHVKGYIDVPNAWNQFRYYDFGLQLIFESKGLKSAPASVTFTNTYEEKDTPTPPAPGAKVGNLTVSKTVDGNAGDTTKAFTFTVSLSNKSINGTYGEMTFVNGVATFALKHSEQKTASTLPAGVEYSVAESEANQDGYTTTSTGSSGTILDGKTSVSAFTNTKNSDGGHHGGDSGDKNKYGNLTISKTVTGTAGNVNQQFTFTVTLNQAITGKYGDMNFDKGVATVTLKHGESVTAKNLPVNITYNVVETEANQDGYTTTSTGADGIILDGKTSVAAFTNTKNNGGGHHGGDSDDKNKYGNLTISKTVTGTGGNVNQQFTFTVMLNQAITGKYGDMSFDKGIATITLKHGESVTAKNLPANITYNVVETEANQNGYTTTSTGASGTILDGKTSVAAFTNHKDSITPDDPKQPTDEHPSTGDTPTTPTIPEGSSTQIDLDNVPQTGDTQNLALWFILMGLSMIGLIASVFAIRNSKNRK